MQFFHILKLEDSFREYEKIASTLAEEIRFAVLMKCLGGQLKTYLQVSLRDSTTYDELREAAIRYDQSTIRWTNAMALGSAVASPADTAIPMDVDRIEKGGKGKGNPSPLARARTRTKESRNRNKVTKVTILAKGMEINSRLRGVQRDRHGKIHHGTTIQMVLEKVENPKRETKARILEKARM